MKIFERDGKINFVDDNNVFVGFDYGQSCCESFGYSLTHQLPTDFDDGNNGIDPEGFQFDTGFFTEKVPLPICEGGAVAFRLLKGDEEIFLTLWNVHNGYYAHGFKMMQGDLCIQDGYL